MNLRVLLPALFFMSVVFGAALPASGAPYVIGYDETRSLIADKTAMTYDRGHGTQVEFVAGNGKTYLLYPGNTVIVRGKWKLTRTSNPKVFDMCFRYPDNSHNPVTGQSGGGWSSGPRAFYFVAGWGCGAAGFYVGDLVEGRDGDVLGLARSKEVPFVLARKKTRLDALIRLVTK